MASSEALLREISHLRDLARHLVRGDASQAEDLTQDTLVMALQAPPAPGWNLRTWLRGAARNLARQARRTEGRRRYRENRAPPPEEVRDPHDVVERYETIRQMVDEVHRLSEPYRSAILLRYFDGLDAGEIARQRQVPAATVRSWLKRGLDQVRSRLEEQGRRRGEDWRASLIAFVADSSAPPLPVVAPGGKGLLGSLGTAKLMGVVAFVLVAMPVCLRVLYPGTTAPLAPSTEHASGEASGAPGLPDRDGQTATVVTSLRVEHPLDSRPPERPSGWKLRGKLLGLDPAIPFRSPLVLHLQWEEPPEEGNQRWQIDVLEDGSFRTALTGFPEDREGIVAMLLEADDPDYVPMRRVIRVADQQGEPLGTEHEFECDLQVAPAAVVVGRVVDESGRPIPAATVYAYRLGESPVERRNRIRTQTDAQGFFHLRARETGELSVVATSFSHRRRRTDELTGERRDTLEKGANLRPAAVFAVLETGRWFEVPDLVMREGEHITGSVLDSRGRPLPDAIVMARRAGPFPEDARRSEKLLGPDRFSPYAQVAATGADGSFEIRGLLSGAYRVGVVSHLRTHCHPSIASAELGFVEVRAPFEGVELQLQASLLSVEILGAAGPLAEATVMLAPVDKRKPLEERVRQELFISPTDFQGRLSLYVTPGLDYEAVIRKSGFVESRTIIRVPPLAKHLLEVIKLVSAPPRPTLIVRFGASRGASVARAWFELGTQDDRHHHGSFEQSILAPGVFELRPEMPGEYVLWVRPGADERSSHGFFLEERHYVELEAGERTEVEIPLRPGGRLAVRAIDGNGNGLEASCTLRDAQERPVSCYWTSDSTSLTPWLSRGRLRPGGFCSPQPALPAGPFTIEVSYAGYRTAVVPLTIQPFETTTLRVELEAE